MIDIIIKYVQRHPWQTIEHLVVAILLTTCFGQQRCPPACSRSAPPAPLHILDAPEVVKAPPPTMDVKGLAPGQALHAADARGDIYRLVLQEPLYVVNAYFTRAVR